MNRPSSEVVVGDEVSLWRLLRQKHVLGAFALLFVSGLVTLITSCAAGNGGASTGAPTDQRPVPIVE